MTHQENDIFAKGVLNQIGPLDKRERVYLESLIRSDYERCHPDETLEELKHRARFSKEDKGLLRDWMALAAERASARRNEKRLIDCNIAGAVRRCAEQRDLVGAETETCQPRMERRSRCVM
jgi:hypothetical protein